MHSGNRSQIGGTRRKVLRGLGGQLEIVGFEITTKRNSGLYWLQCFDDVCCESGRTSLSYVETFFTVHRLITGGYVIGTASGWSVKICSSYCLRSLE